MLKTSFSRTLFNLEFVFFPYDAVCEKQIFPHSVCDFFLISMSSDKYFFGLLLHSYIYLFVSHESNRKKLNLFCVVVKITLAESKFPALNCMPELLFAWFGHRLLLLFCFFYPFLLISCHCPPTNRLINISASP